MSQFKARLQPITHVKNVDVYDVVQYINKGSFAIVVSAKKKNEPDSLYAIKLINMENFDQTNLDRVKREVEINGLVSHKNIVEVFEVYQDGFECSLVMEYMQGGDLFSLVYDNGCLDEGETKQITIQVLDAIKYLHNIRIAHRDIKPENIVFDKVGPDRTAKLIDFGFGKIESFDSNSILMTPVGSIGYYAPEITKTNASYSLSVDMWSLGCIVYFMLSKQPPFHAATETEIENRSSRADFQFPVNIEISERAKDFIRNLLQLTPQDRMTAEEAMDHKWFLPSVVLSNSGNKSSKSNPKIGLGISEEEKMKVRESINQLIDCERKDMNTATDLNCNLEKSILDGINLDAAENPRWKPKRNQNKQS